MQAFAAFNWWIVSDTLYFEMGLSVRCRRQVGGFSDMFTITIYLLVSVISLQKDWIFGLWP